MWVPLCESGLGGGWWPSTPVPCIRVTTPSHTNIVRFRALLQNTCGRMMASKRSRESDHSDEAEADPRPASAVNIGGSAVMMVVTLANSKYNKIYREILVNVKRRVVPAPDSTHTDARTPSRTRARATHTRARAHTHTQTRTVCGRARAPTPTPTRARAHTHTHSHTHTLSDVVAGFEVHDRERESHHT